MLSSSEMGLSGRDYELKQRLLRTVTTHNANTTQIETLGYRHACTRLLQRHSLWWDTVAVLTLGLRMLLTSKQKFPLNGIVALAERRGCSLQRACTRMFYPAACVRLTTGSYYARPRM